MIHKKIAIALSGGVDSAVAAYLLKEQGHDLIGIYMKNWSSTEGLILDACPWVQDREDAIAVAAHLGIPFHTVDFEAEYRDRIFGYFIDEYRGGRTPNPDVLCNNLIKFDLLLAEAKRLGYDLLATGHYARTAVHDGKYSLLQGVDPDKDQSYFLHRLNQDQLSAAVFPLGELTKAQVRTIAQKATLPVAAKKDSQGLCFVGKINLGDFLAQEIATKSGDILDLSGDVIGAHPGAAYFTVGQRRGIGLAAPEPLYVIDTDVETNTITVGGESELYKEEVLLENLHWISGNCPDLPLSCKVQIRYHSDPVSAVLRPDGRLIFGSPQRAIAPGQFAVLLDDDEVLGGGVMETKVPSFV